MLRIHAQWNGEDMIEIISPALNASIGGPGVRYGYVPLAYWELNYAKSLFGWLTGIIVNDAADWPDDDNGSTVYFYPVVIWGRTDSVRYKLGCLNSNDHSFNFHPLDEFGAPMSTTLFSTANSSMQNASLAFHVAIPLATSWIDPVSKIRVFAQGNRTIVALTEEDTEGKYDTAIRPFAIDIRPPSQPVLDQINCVVTEPFINITGTIANIDGGGYIVTIES